MAVAVGQLVALARLLHPVVAIAVCVRVSVCVDGGMGGCGECEAQVREWCRRNVFRCG